MVINRNIKLLLPIILILTAVVTVNPALGAKSSQANQEPAAEKAQQVYYTVENGDCLWTLAEKFNVDVYLLAEVNGLDPEGVLLQGERLVIPGGPTISYTVKQGDTLYRIAARFHTNVETVTRENNIRNAEILLEGQKILIPRPERAVWASLWKADFNAPQYSLWPVKGVVSSTFGPRQGRFHEGLDIAAEQGRSIRALDAGTVVFAAERGSYGKAVIINHGGGWRTLYGHASELLVSPGERVQEGQIIARVGNTGRSTGPHLHLEILYRGTPVNPEDCLPRLKN